MLNSVRNSIEKGHEDLYFFRLNEKVGIIVKTFQLIMQF